MEHDSEFKLNDSIASLVPPDLNPNERMWNEMEILPRQDLETSPFNLNDLKDAIMSVLAKIPQKR